MKSKKIIVSHPNKQYVHQMCYALQQKGYLCKFITSIWYKPKSFPFNKLSYIPPLLQKKLHSFFLKRYFQPLNEKLIHLFPFPELIRQLLGLVFDTKGNRWIFYVDRLHDWYVSKFINFKAIDIVVGYENSSLLTFKQAKKAGKITILDLAQVHHTFIGQLRVKYESFKNVLRSEKLFRQVNKLKAQHYTYTDFIFVLSTFAKQTLINSGIQADKIYIVNLGFDPKNFSLKPSFRTHSEQEFHILFAGTLTMRKGFQLVLEAFQQLNLKNARLTMVGPIADGHEILERYRGIYTHVPFLQHNELVKYYQDADVFVFPSYLDSWAMVVLEAMACGTPVIISENTGSKDAVEKGGGFVIPVDDLNALKEKILFFYCNRTQIREIGLQAYQIALTYTWATYYQQVQAAIEDIMEREYSSILSQKQLL